MKILMAKIQNRFQKLTLFKFILLSLLISSTTDTLASTVVSPLACSHTSTQACASGTAHPAAFSSVEGEAQILFDHGDNINSLTSSEFQNFNSIAYYEAQIWGDTIYEGDVQSLGEAQLVQVLWLKQSSNGSSFYLITYREPAMDLSQCDDSDDQSCHRGWVKGQSMVSLDLSQVKELGHKFESEEH